MTANTQCPFCQTDVNINALCCDSMREARKAFLAGVKRTAMSDTLFGVPVTPSKHVYAQADLRPLDKSFVLPLEAETQRYFRRVAKAFAKAEPTIIYGERGTCKDALAGFLSNLYNVPALAITLGESSDLQSMLFKQAISPTEGTYYQYGALWRALTEGHPDTGEPMLIVLSDGDRMSPHDLNLFRSVLDTTAGQINGPTGEIVPIKAGTRILMTANSIGNGADGYGANAIDISMLDRFSRKIKSVAFSASEKAEACIKRCGAPQEWHQPLTQCLSAITRAVTQEEIENDLSMRGVNAWLRSAIQEVELGNTETALFEGFRDVAEGEESEEAEKLFALVTPHLKQ